MNTRKHSQVVSWVRREFRPADFLPALPTALVCYFLTIIFSVSFAALIFRGPLESSLSIGIGMTLYTAFAVGLVMTFSSSVRGVIGIPSDRSAPILAVLASSLLISLPAGASAEQQLDTCLAGLLLSTLLSGLILALLGRYKLGRLIRFLPYPVIGGFMAGAGLLLAKGALTVLCGFEVTRENFLLLAGHEQSVRWAPAAVLALTLVFVLRRFSHFLVVPSFILGSVLLFYALSGWTGSSLSELRSKGLLPGPFPESVHWNPFSMNLVEHAHWPTVFGGFEGIGTVLLVISISVLMISSALELHADYDIDADRELQAAGLANLASVLGGGIIGLHSLSLSSLVAKLGPQSRWVGLLSALGAGITLWIGPSLVGYLPVPVIGGLLLFLGLNFLYDWLWDTYRRIPKSDYVMIWLILIVIAGAGYIMGVGLGLIMAVALFALRYSRIEVIRHALSGDQYPSHVDRTDGAKKVLEKKHSQIHILTLQGYLFFGTAHSLLEMIRKRVRQTGESRLGYLIIDFRHVSGIDSSALICFVKLKQIAAQNSFQIVLSATGKKVLTTLRRNPELIHKNQLVFSRHADLDHAVEWCEDRILIEHPEDVSPPLPLMELLSSAFKGRPGLAERVHRSFSGKKVGKETVLAEQGSNGNTLYFIESGKISARLKTEQNEMLRLRTMGSGSVVGETGFYLNIPRTASLVADEDCFIHELSREALQKLEKQDQEAACAFHEFLAKILADRLLQTNRMLEAALR